MHFNEKSMEAHQMFIAPNSEKKPASVDSKLLCEECTSDSGCCSCRVHRSPRCRLNPATAAILHATVLAMVLVTSLTGTFYIWQTDIFDRFVASQMVMDPKSSAFAWFLDPPIKPEVRVYIFNYTNIENFLYNGSKIEVQEVGPLVYTETINRREVVEMNDSTLDFLESKNYQYRPDLSKLEPDAQVRVPNLPSMSVVSQMRTMGTGIMPLLGSFAFLVGFNPEPFVTVGANGLIWGYDDNVYWAARTYARASPLHQHKVPPNARFGLLAAKNQSSESIAIHTGASDYLRMGNIIRWNHEPTLKKWSGECDKLEASDGGLFSPLKVRRKEPIHVFKAEACRRINFEYSGKVSVYGMESYQYLIPEDEFVMSKGPSCYCEFNGCLADGLFDTSPCSYGAPVMVSYPHFFRSDPKLLEPFTGLKPDARKHTMRLDVHSRMGLTLNGVSRLQLNVLVQPFGNHFKEIPEGMVLPIAWFEMTLPPFDEEYTKTLQMATRALDILELVLLYGLPLTALCAIFALLRLYFSLRLRTVRPSTPVLHRSLPISA